MAMEASLMEGGIACLQSARMPSTLAELGFGVGGVARELGSLWRWGALVLLAAYGSLIARTTLVLRRLRRGRQKPVVLQPQEQHFISDDDDTCSSCSSDDDSEEEELLSSETEEEVVREGYVGDFLVNEGQSGGFHLRRLPELVRGGTEVVKAWGGRDLRFDDSAVVGGGGGGGGGGVLSLWDLYRGEVVRPFLAAGSTRVAACVAAARPSVVQPAGDYIGVWNAMAGGRMSATSAELSPRLRRRVVRFGGAGKVVYVGDGPGFAAEVDLRKARSPVPGVAVDDVMWWDADAVVESGVDVAGFEEEASWSPVTCRFRTDKK